MAAPPPDLTTPEGRREAIAMLDPDFQGLLERKEVSEISQARLGVAGVKSISRFSVIGEANGDVRTFAVDHLALDRNRDVVQVAALVDAWQASKTRMTVRHQAEAEAVTASLPPPVNKTEAQDLRIRFEQMHYRMEDKVAPASGTLEQLFEQVEAGEWKNMSLVQFMSRDDQDTEPLAAVIDRSGVVKVKKGHGESAPPKSAEELRQKIKLMGHCYLMTQLKFPNRVVLRDINPYTFNKYADYLMGEHVLGLKAKDAKGDVVAAPTLELVLSYEAQIRKLMTKKMNDGVHMGIAMEQAMQDTTVKERYFLTPAALTAATSREDLRLKSRSPKRARTPERDRGDDRNRKGRGKRGGRGKGPGGKTLNTRTPDGHEICFPWNNKDQRCRFKCGRVHCCQICFGNHPAHSCRADKKEGKDSKDTAGGGSGGSTSK